MIASLTYYLVKLKGGVKCVVEVGDQVPFSNRAVQDQCGSRTNRVEDTRSCGNLTTRARVASNEHCTLIEAVPSLVLRKLSWFGAIGVVLAVVAVPQFSMGQELDCRVQLDRSQLSGGDFEFLDDLERQAQEYMNTRSWTDDEFLPQEQITCSMQIVVQEALSLSRFRARLIVASRRPIHGTSQSTVVVRINDSNWRFEYGRGTSLNFDLGRYDALTSVLDFYAYVILGYDYDTFSELGGTDHFETARRIATRAENSGDPGWSASGTQNNRRKLIRDLLSQRTEPLRQAYYRYHLEGLDRFVKAPEKARATILEVVETMRDVSRDLSSSYPLDLFFSTKFEELAAVFREGEFQDRAYSLLTQVDPSHSSEYDRIIQ